MNFHATQIMNFVDDFIIIQFSSDMHITSTVKQLFILSAIIVEFKYILCGNELRRERI